MNDDELSSLRNYLATEDERERQNRAAERAKREARRDAILLADANSTLEPLQWAPLPECTSCSDPLTCDNRSGVIGLCVACLTVRNARAARIRELAKEQKKTDRAGWDAMWGILPWIVLMIMVAAAAGSGLAYLWDHAAWAIGQAFP